MVNEMRMLNRGLAHAFNYFGALQDTEAQVAYTAS